MTNSVDKDGAGVELRRLDAGQQEINFGESLRFEVAVKLNGLKPGDVNVEILLGLLSKQTELQNSLRYSLRYPFVSTGTMTDAGEDIFAADVRPEHCGKLEYRIRAYPYHEMLTHPFELGMMRWL